MQKISPTEMDDLLAAAESSAHHVIAGEQLRVVRLPDGHILISTTQPCDDGTVPVLMVQCDEVDLLIDALRALHLNV